MEGDCDGRSQRLDPTQLGGPDQDGVLQPLELAGHASMQLWWADLDQAHRYASEGCLSREEVQHSDRFRQEVLTLRYRAGRVLLRRLLASKLGCAPDAVRLETGTLGKPHLAGDRSLQFNLSHSAQYALFGLAEGTPLGVDIEVNDRAFDDLDATAATCFTSAELLQLRAHPASERYAAFLRGWTRKEACLKAIGTGLSVEPCSFEAGLETTPRQVRFELDTGPCWVTVQSLACVPALTAAVAWLHHDSLPHAR